MFCHKPFIFFFKSSFVYTVLLSSWVYHMVVQVNKTYGNWQLYQTRKIKVDYPSQCTGRVNVYCLWFYVRAKNKYSKYYFGPECDVNFNTIGYTNVCFTLNYVEDEDHGLNLSEMKILWVKNYKKRVLYLDKKI